jgi:beta-galactosidase
VAVVKNSYKKGQTLLVGSHPSIHCHQSKGGINLAYFREIALQSGLVQHVKLSNGNLQARIQESLKHRYIWIINPTREVQNTSVLISGRFGSIHSLIPLWNKQEPQISGNSFDIEIPGRDAAILELMEA